MTLNPAIALRTIAEHASRGVVLRRQMPARYGGDWLVVSPGALLKLWRPNLETVDPQLFTWADRFIHPGNVVWDIGANIGLFAFAAASRAGRHGRVIAVEADIWLAGLLRRSAAHRTSERAPVDIIPTAVSAQVGLAQFNIAQRSRAANFLEGAGGSTQTGGIRETQTVVSVTLDWLLGSLPAPHVLKIDVEGAEAQVLRGAEHLLSTARPTIICEVRPDNAIAVASILHQYGYTLFDLADESRGAIKQAAFNTLAVA